MNKQNAINLGISYGIIAIILFLVQALTSGGLIFTFAIGLITLVAMIALPIIYIRKQRLANGGFITFGDAFKLSFLGLLIGGLISTVFSAIYIQFIDPAFVEDTILRTLESQKRWMEGSVGQEQMEETMRLTEQGMRDSFTTLGMLKTFGYYLLFYLVLSLIFAAFLKVNPPEGQEVQVSDEIQSAN